MIFLKSSICLIVIFAGIISTYGSESVSYKCPSASNVHKGNQNLPKISKIKRDPGCMDLKLAIYDDKIQSSLNNDAIKRNAPNPTAQTQVIREKRELDPVRCDPKYPGAGPCTPPPPLTNTYHQAF